MKTKTIHGLLIATLLALTAILYLPGLSGPFLLDDQESIEPARLDSFSLSQWLAVSLANETGPMGRPATIATFALTHLFFGPEPYAYKAINLIIHLLSGLMIFLLFSQILSIINKPKYSFPVSFLATILWLIHPIQVSTVLYAVQRMTGLSTLFMLLGLLCYLKGRIRFNGYQKYGITLIIIGYLVFFPLAMLSKETGVLFPFYAFTIEWLILKFKGRDRLTSNRIKHLQIIFCLMIILAALLYYWANLPYFLERFAEKNMSLSDRLITQSLVIWMYLKMLLFPRLADMGLYQDDFKLITQFNLSTLLSLFGIIALLVTLFKARFRAPILAFSIAWFLTSQLLESTILPLELMFEHRVYLGAAAIFLLIAYYFWDMAVRLTLRLKMLMAVAGIMVLSLMAFMTYQRIQAWSSADDFLRMEALYHPTSPRVQIELANWLLKKKQYILALDALSDAQSLQPFNAGIALHQLLIYCQADHTPASRYEYTATILRNSAITPYVIRAFDAIVSNMFHQKCQGLDKNEVIKLIDIALANPFLKHKPLYRATLYHLKAGIVLSQKKLPETLILLKKSYETHPKRLSPLIEKARLEINANLISEAQQTVYTIRTHETRYLPEHKEIEAIQKALQKILETEQNHVTEN